MESKGTTSKAKKLAETVAYMRQQGSRSLEPYASGLASHLGVSVEEALAEIRRQGAGEAKSDESVAQMRLRQDRAARGTAAAREYDHEE